MTFNPKLPLETAVELELQIRNETREPLTSVLLRFIKFEEPVLKLPLGAGYAQIVYGSREQRLISAWCLVREVKAESRKHTMAALDCSPKALASRLDKVRDAILLLMFGDRKLDGKTKMMRLMKECDWTEEEIACVLRTSISKLRALPKI